MKIMELSNDVTFTVHHIGGTTNQHDYIVQAISRGTVVGDLSYTTFEDEVSVNYIEVYERGNGYGKMLLRYLQSLYPQTELNIGMTTTDGTRLIDSLTYHTEKSNFFDQFKELDTLRSQLDAATDIEDWDYVNDLRDRIDDLEDELYDKSPYIKIIA